MRLGGLQLSSPTTLHQEFEASKHLTQPLTLLLSDQSRNFSFEVLLCQEEIRKAIRQERRSFAKSEADALLTELPEDLRYASLLAQEKGASSWLNTLPITEHGFALHKRAFRDAIALRYGWTPEEIPVECVCGKSFTVEHALSCQRGGFPMLRHNEVRDLTASLLSEVCANVAIEPMLQELSGESLHGAANKDGGARLDIAVDGFWGAKGERTYMDVRVFNPFAPSNRKSSLSSVYRSHEREKRRAYCQRVTEVELGTFTPLVFSLTGGTAKEATVFYKRLASLLSDKWQHPYSITLNWIRVSLGFCLLRSCIRCIRGARSSCGFPAHAS